jgi:hypothetical protein
VMPSDDKLGAYSRRGHGRNGSNGLLRRSSVPTFVLGASENAFYCTVSVVDPVVPPELAPMVVVPAAIQLAWPPTLGALAMVATVACDELQ